MKFGMSVVVLLVILALVSPFVITFVGTALRVDDDDLSRTVGVFFVGFAAMAGCLLGLHGWLW